MTPARMSRPLVLTAVALSGACTFAWVQPPSKSLAAPRAPISAAAEFAEAPRFAAGATAAEEEVGSQLWRVMAAAMAAIVVFVGVPSAPANAEGALVSSKIMMGGASSGTKDALGSKKTITRGMNLEKADYSNQKLMGVSFQQSLIRSGSFKNTDLTGASFFDADLQGADMTGATLTQANLELCRMTDADLTNAVVTEAYVNGTTRLEVKSVEGADFTDTPLRKDQQKYLCAIAKGTNPKTKVDTRESLGCPEE